MKRRLVASNLLAAFLFISATPSPTGQYATYRGTIGAVDAKANAIDLTTGVGMALRVVRIQLSPDTRVQEGGSSKGSCTTVARSRSKRRSSFTPARPALPATAS